MCIWAHFNDDQAFWRFINNDEAKKYKRTLDNHQCFLLPNCVQICPCLCLGQENNLIVFAELALCFMTKKCIL